MTHYAPLKFALESMSALVARASQVRLTPAQLQELHKNVDALIAWPRSDTNFARSRNLVGSITLSGVLADPPRRPTLPDQILSECVFLLNFVAGIEGISSSDARRAKM